MEKPYSAYYWIMALACIVPATAWVALPNGIGRDWNFFVLLFLSPVLFTLSVLVMNRKNGV